MNNVYTYLRGLFSKFRSLNHLAFELKLFHDTDYEKSLIYPRQQCRTKHCGYDFDATPIGPSQSGTRTRIEDIGMLAITISRVFPNGLVKCPTFPKNFLDEAANHFRQTNTDALVSIKNHFVVTKATKLLTLPHKSITPRYDVLAKMITDCIHHNGGLTPNFPYVRSWNVGSQTGHHIVRT